MRRVRVPALLLAALLLLALPAVVAPTGVAGAAPSASAADAKITPDARRALAGGRHAQLYVWLRERADLSGAARRGSHADRVGYGRRQLVETAERSQRGVRDLLRRRHVRHDPLWVVNAVRVHDADAALAAELAARPEVKMVRAGQTFAVPTVTPATAQAAVDGLEWNIARIGADRVWSQYGTRGEGIVVANIDTGVQFDHPALVGQYRGNLGDGRFEHDYNWFDLYQSCAGNAPCDTNGHGTHTMGTMVGDDGTNHIGVAPGSRWIAAKGCQSTGCDLFGLLYSAAFVLGPFDRNGENPRPDLAPHIVNNSWGSDIANDPFFEEVVQSWIQVGIMPVFSAGNDGPSCGSAGSPADYLNSYAVAAFDVNNAIADFSSRGAVGAAEIKPDVAAPGVAVRSSVFGGRYETYDGTSMAAPHVAGAVALLWAAAPALIGDLPGTRKVLDDTAVDVPDTTCGGTADDNAVWGEGRLDVYAALGRAPRGGFGTVTGTVRSGGAVLRDVTVNVSGGPRVARTVRTDASGRYTVAVPAGTYEVSAAPFGYSTASVSGRVVSAGASTTTDLTVIALARYPISGTVRDKGGSLATGVPVRLLGAPLPSVVTGADGRYRIDDVPVGTYTLAYGAGRCLAGGTQPVVVDAAETMDLDPAAASDAAGYYCYRASTAFAAGTSVLPLTGDDESLEISLPFAMPFYGGRFTRAWVSTNGFLTFDRAADNSINREIPNASYPNASIFAFWDDLVVDAAASVRTATSGTAPNRRYVVEWRNVTFYGSTDRVTFSVELAEQGGMTVHYGSLTGGPDARGAGATIGLENLSGIGGLQYSLDSASLTSGTALIFRAAGGIRGTVTRPDGGPASDALVEARIGDARPVAARTAGDGTYVLQLPLGSYTVDISLATYGTSRENVVLDTDGVLVTHDVRLQPNERTVSGVVYDDLGKPVQGAEVWLTGGDTDRWFGPTGADGAYRFEKVPESAEGVLIYTRVPECMPDLAQTWVPELVGADLVRDVPVYARPTSSGYQCRLAAAAPVTVSTPVAVTPFGSPLPQVSLPFQFPFYGGRYTSAYVSSYGFLTFAAGSPQSGDNSRLPASNVNSADLAVYGFWDDLRIDAAATVRTGVTGTAPNRTFTVSWNNALIAGTSVRVTFDIVLHENGTVVLQNRSSSSDPRAAGSSATFGLERDNSSAFPYERQIPPGTAVTILAPATVTGVVTDESTGAPLAGATVRVLRDGAVAREVVTDASGRYSATVLLGSFAVQGQHSDYYTRQFSPVRLHSAGSTVVQDLSLPRQG
ncbi:carboxypeptidase regulatory-like domain-containing protein [Micromonospora zamorensis]|uniref:carboxypeptidase regulatory-like domain-containing protein n=1 Tax=Micromonospora zamorensis TaxID=709883 RepID=UPI002ED5F4C6|nr:carboxypeptidase regulatory-like domain-containing protein [Micromonospora zamorensis]